MENKKMKTLILLSFLLYASAWAANDNLVLLKQVKREMGEKSKRSRMRKMMNWIIGKKEAKYVPFNAQNKDAYNSYLKGIKKAILEKSPDEFGGVANLESGSKKYYFPYAQLVNDSKVIKSATTDLVQDELPPKKTAWEMDSEEKALLNSIKIITDVGNINKLRDFMSANPRNGDLIKRAFFQGTHSNAYESKFIHAKIKPDELMAILNSQFNELFTRAVSKIKVSKDYLIAGKNEKTQIHARILSLFNNISSLLEKGPVDKYIQLYGKLNGGMLNCNDDAMNTLDNLELDMTLLKGAKDLEVLNFLFKKYKRTIIDGLIADISKASTDERFKKESVEIALLIKLNLSDLLNLGVGTKFIYNDMSTLDIAKTLSASHLLSKLLEENYTVENFISFLFEHEDAWGTILPSLFWDQLPDADPLKAEYELEYEAAYITGKQDRLKDLNKQATINLLLKAGIIQENPFL